MPVGLDTGTNSPLGAAQQGLDFESSAGQVFGVGFGEGVRYSSFGAIGGLAQWYTAGADKYSRKQIGLDIGGYPIYDTKDSGVVPDEKSWKDSQYYRLGLKYQPNITWNQAQLLATREDARTHDAWITSNAKSGISAFALRMLGDLTGSALDPTNYINVVGLANKVLTAFKIAEKIPLAVKIAKSIERGGMAAKGATDAAVSVAAIQPLIMAEEKKFQGDYDAIMALSSVAMAGGIGTGFGFVAGKIHKIRAEAHARAVAKTVRQITTDLPPDVSGIIKPAIEEARAIKIDRLAELEKQKVDVETRIAKETVKEKPIPTSRQEILKAIKEEIAARPDTAANRKLRQSVDLAINNETLIGKQAKTVDALIARKLGETKIGSEQTASLKYLGMTEKELLSLMRTEISSPTAVAGGKTYKKDAFGVTTDVEGFGSTFPEYFRNQGLKKEDVVAIIDKKLSGAKLTDKQATVLDTLLSGKIAELESQKHFVETEASQKAAVADRPSAEVSGMGLEVGDVFKIHGEKYEVSVIDEKGITLKLETGESITLEPTSKIPMPDEGSVVKAKTVHPEVAALNKKIAELRDEIAQRDELRYDTGQEPFVSPKEADIKEVADAPGYADMTKQTEELQAEVNNIKSETEALTPEQQAELKRDMEELENVNEEIKKIPLYEKAYRAAVDCILGGGK